MPDYTLSAKITGDSSGYKKSVQDAEKATNKFQSKIDSMASKVKSVGSKISRIGTALTAGVTAPLIVAGKTVVTAASDFDENLNKISVAFGDSAEDVKAWADTATESFGLSMNQALEATSLFGDMATSMGISQSEAASMSTTLAGLAGDMASFKNIGIDQAMAALNGVFTGETESLKQLGIVMTEVNLQEFADGLGLVYDDMTQAEKVQLRYNYVMEMSKNAIGDYARTSDGTANSMRTFQASVDNLSIVLGQKLLPLVTPLIQKATEMANAFAAADPEFQQLVLTIAGIAMVAGPALIVIGGLISAIGTIISAVSTTVSFISSIVGMLTSPVGIILLAIAALIAVGYLLISNWDAIRAKAGEVWDWIQGKLQAFDEFLTNIFAQDWSKNFGMIGDVMNGFLATVSNIWESIQKIFSGVVNFVAGVFSGDWERAWRGVSDIFSGIWDGLVSIVKGPLNGIISLVNAAISGLNSISVKIPDWVPAFGGRTFGLNIPKIPYLAHGTDDWQGGFAYMNEGGRGELTYLPNGAQVIPHDISVKYAKEAARKTSSSEPLSLEALYEGISVIVNTYPQFDGTPLKETFSDYTIKKIGDQQRISMKAMGA